MYTLSRRPTEKKGSSPGLGPTLDSDGEVLGRLGERAVGGWLLAAHLHVDVALGLAGLVRVHEVGGRLELEGGELAAPVVVVALLLLLTLRACPGGHFPGESVRLIAIAACGTRFPTARRCAARGRASREGPRFGLLRGPRRCRAARIRPRVQGFDAYSGPWGGERKNSRY